MNRPDDADGELQEYSRCPHGSDDGQHDDQEQAPRVIVNAPSRRQLLSHFQQTATAGARATARWPAGRHGYTERADVIFARARVLQTRLSAPQLPCGGNATRTPLPCPLSDNVSTFRGDSIRGWIARLADVGSTNARIRPRRVKT